MIGAARGINRRLPSQGIAGLRKWHLQDGSDLCGKRNVTLEYYILYTSQQVVVLNLSKASGWNIQPTLFLPGSENEIDSNFQTLQIRDYFQQLDDKGELTTYPG